jgi:3-oxoacyl-[acyl-carrier protein] reductase
MDLGLTGKWALVCGASKGLGFGCAAHLVQAGCNVVVAARTELPLYDAVAKLKVLGGEATVVGVASDVTTPAGRDAIWHAVGGPGKDFDIVVTNAGGPPPGDFRDWEREQWMAAIDANMLTPIEFIKATVDGMASRGFGRIINITSGAVKAPIDILGLSNGARSGLTGFVAGLARSELAAQGVTMNNLLPGAFETDRLKQTMAGVAKKTDKSVESIMDLRRQTIPAKRFGTADEFGAICAFLCSQHASFINGQNILADGGAYSGTF